MALRRVRELPNQKGAFTPREKLFMGRYVATGDLIYASEKAGFASSSGGANALARPAVAAEIQRLQLARIQNEVLPLAVSRHLALLKDTEVGGQTLNRAIEMAYKYGLGGDRDGAGKEAHEMTAAELAEAIATLRRAAADKAKPVLELEAVSSEPGVFD